MKRFLAMLVLAAAAGLSTVAMAADPTLHQVYQAVQEGRLNDAQSMMTQVLHDHPDSAKAHYVEAEVLVRMGRAADAQDQLGQAERLKPGLPFARPDSVRSLRAMIARQTGAAPAMLTPSSAAPASHFPWGIVLIVGGAVLLLVVFLRGQRSRPVVMVQGGPGMPGGAMGPMGGGYPPPGYGGGGGYPMGGGGMGSGIVSGLATGAALGAGMVAGEALANDLMGHHGSGANPAPFVDNGQQPVAFDDGGSDFGVADAGSWDDSSDLAGGGDGGDWS
ncbi:uncharacterized protein E1O_02550 [Burkholderiales bacterium GJ-E10]|nr:uncharacterized protein E1O_02550 [Burkholderiales bacterium GJ-E10]